MPHTLIVRMVWDRPRCGSSQAEERAASKERTRKDRERIAKWMAEQERLPETLERAKKDKERNEKWVAENANELAKEKAEQFVFCLMQLCFDQEIVHLPNSVFERCSTSVKPVRCSKSPR